MPSPLNPPSGCRFHTRCWLAQDICKQQVPEWRNVSTTARDHWVACHFAPFTRIPAPNEVGTTIAMGDITVAKTIEPNTPAPVA